MQDVKQPSKLKVKYQLANDHKIKYVDGANGGINPQTKIFSINFFANVGIPQIEVYELDHVAKTAKPKSPPKMEGTMIITDTFYLPAKNAWAIAEWILNTCTQAGITPPDGSSIFLNQEKNKGDAK